MALFKIELCENSIPPVMKNGALQCFAHEDGAIPPRSRGLIKFGFKLEIPNDYFVHVFGHNIKSLGGVGDSDYRGMYSVIVVNDKDEDMVYTKGDHVGNICFPKIRTPVLQVVEE